MLNNDSKNWAGRILSASVGSAIAASFSIWNGQPPVVTLIVISFATGVTLLLDEYGVI